MKTSEAWRLEPTLRRVRVADGAALQVAEYGQGPPLLLLHGFPDNGDLWVPVAKRLARHHRLWLPDLRGYRHSDKPPHAADYSIDALVADVQALVTQMADGHTGPGSASRVSVAGHDWGGMLAWAVAARHPASIERLVVINAPHPCRFAELLQSDAAQRAASAYVQRLCSPGASAALAADDFARLRGLVRSNLPELPAEELESQAQVWALPGALDAMLNWYRALDFERALAEGVSSLPDLGSASGHIEAPTLVLWGERDGSFVPANLDGLQRWVPQLTLRLFGDAGHWLPRERSDAVASAMLDFLGSTAPH